MRIKSKFTLTNIANTIFALAMTAGLAFCFLRPDLHASGWLWPFVELKEWLHSDGTGSFSNSLTSMSRVLRGSGHLHTCAQTEYLRTYSRELLDRSFAHHGSDARLREVFQRAQYGQPIKLGVIGGSVSKGHGLTRRLDQVYWSLIFRWIKKTWPDQNHSVQDGSVAAMNSDYFSPCVVNHLDDDVDLVLIELAINDDRIEPKTTKTMESLIRHLLELPRPPAIVMVQSFTLQFSTISRGGDMHLGLAAYYDIPVISLRNVLMSAVLQDESLIEKYFYMSPNETTGETSPDLRHISAAGHAMLVDLVLAHWSRLVCELRLGYTPVEAHHPILTGIDYSVMPRVAMMSHFEPHAITPRQRPFCYSTHAPKNPLRPISARGWRLETIRDKVFWTSNQPGSVITFQVHTAPGGVLEMMHLESNKSNLGKVSCQVDDGYAHVISGYWVTQGGAIGVVYRFSSSLMPGLHNVTCVLLAETDDPVARAKQVYLFKIMALMGF